MRVLVATEEFVAVGFNVPVAELLTARELTRHEALRELGPDLLDESFDAGAAMARARAQPAATPAADVLLNQRVVAGIGNELKSEVLFVAGVYPFTPVSALADADLARIAGHRARPAAREHERSRAPGPVARTPDAGQPRSRRGALGLRTGRKALQKMRHADSGEEDGHRRQGHVLVPAVPAGAYRCVSRFVMADSSTSRH